jgi:phospholipase C
MSQLDQIEHFVVLMLENRSFDSLLGKLYGASPAFDGLTGTESNLDQSGSPIGVWNSPGTDDETMSIPTPDPGELFDDINMQLFDAANPGSPAPAATMNGFAKNYMAQATGGDAQYDPKNVMHYFKPEQVPVLSKLASQFAVCDRWFASAPCQTWPNRFFVHTGTANGYENNPPIYLPYMMDTIYNRFELAGTVDWKIYFHDIAQAKALSQLWLLAGNFHFIDAFIQDAAQNTLPTYSFIEPCYFADWRMPNDQHPPHVVTLGEQLIATVYNASRATSAWTKTMLIITFDEHGGCYDHLPPPAAVPPSQTATQPFNFDRYGVRVPAVVVSPFVQQGSVLRVPSTAAAPFDHTSILATLRKRFPELGPPLTARDAIAPDLGNALTLPAATNLGPPSIPALPYTPTPSHVAQVQEQPLNHMQESLVKLAANLPPAAVGAKPETIQAHIGEIQAQPKSPPPEATANVRTAAAYVKERLGQFFAPAPRAQ